MESRFFSLVIDFLFDVRWYRIISCFLWLIVFRKFEVCWVFFIILFIFMVYMLVLNIGRWDVFLFGVFWVFCGLVFMFN